MEQAVLSSGIARAIERRLGPDAPAWELLPATGSAPRTGSPPGALLAVHGGGWAWVGPETLPAMHAAAGRYQAAGWDVLNVDYRAGARSIEDVGAFADALRSALGPRLPMGMYGVSAGGHLALLTAARRDDVRFIVAEGAPTDLRRLTDTPEAQTVGRLARDAFGSSPARLAELSPAHPPVAARIGARLLLATSAADAIVPPGQVGLMVRARPDITTGMVLEAGARPFIHAGVSDAAWARFRLAEQALRQLR